MARGITCVIYLLFCLADYKHPCKWRLTTPEPRAHQPWRHHTFVSTIRLANFTYPDAAVKSPHSDVVFCCWLCWGTVELEAKAPMSGKGAGGWDWWTVLFVDTGDAPAPGGGASLGATPPGGGGKAPRPPPAVERRQKPLTSNIYLFFNNHHLIHAFKILVLKFWWYLNLP